MDQSNSFEQKFVGKESESQFIGFMLVLSLSQPRSDSLT
jgi:hypothetical protein